VESKVWTAEELDDLSPAERHSLFDARVVRTLDQSPPVLIARARARIEERIVNADSRQV
jgi:hypothetical protein